MTTSPQSFRDLLTARPGAVDPLAALAPRTWRAAPPVEDRDAWSGLATADVDHVLESARRWSDAARSDPPTLTLWHRYHATGERVPYETAQRGLLGNVGSAALALAITDEDAWAAELADAIWRLCELSAWCLPSHYEFPESRERPPLPQPGRDILDLSDGYIGGMLAAIDSVAGSRLERSYPGLRARVHHEIRRRVLEPWRTEVYFWHGIDRAPNNWAPWIVSNVLVCAAVVEPSAEVLAEDVARSLEILDRFRAGYAADGSCDEGATYWWWAGATLYEALELLREMSDGAIDGFAVEPVAAMSRFPMLMQIGTDSQVNYSDGAASLPPNSSWHLLTRFGEVVGDEQVARHGRWMGRQHPFRLPDQIAPQFRRALAELRDPGWAQGPAEAGMPASWYAPGTEVAVSRERAGDTTGWFVAAKGGHNNVSHNHNDVGGVIASLDGDPVLIDVGVGEYRRETFDPATRYGIWTMRSAYHSVPLPDGVEQPPGEQFAARSSRFADDGRTAVLSMDLAPAYPPEAGLVAAERTVTLRRGAGSESTATSGEEPAQVRAEGPAGEPAQEPAGLILRDAWRFETPRRMTLVLMTAAEPEISSDTGPDSLGVLHVGAARATFDATGFSASTETIPVEDPKLAAVWGSRVHRIVLTQQEPAVTGELGLEFTRA